MLFVLSACELLACRAGAADLVIDGQSNRLVEGGSYGRLIVRNSSAITVRNARFAIDFDGSVVAIQGSHDVRVENSDIDGGGEACEGVSIVDSQDVTIADNAVHDIADDGFEMSDSSGLVVRGNTIYRLIAKGTDGEIPGPCYNGHSDGLEIVHVASSLFSGNLIFDVRSTAAVFISDDATSPSDYCSDLVFTNNVFVTPESGFTFYAYQTAGLAIHNNVIWKGYYGGLAVGGGVTDMDVTNNVLHSLNYSHNDPPFVPAEHRFRHNRIADVASWNQTPAIFTGALGNTVGEPEFTVAPGLSGFENESAWRQPATGPLLFALSDFTPAAGSSLVDAGENASAPPLDALGHVRPQGAAVDIGAVERAPEPGSAFLGVVALGLLALESGRRPAECSRTRFPLLDSAPK
jgi:parallel beta-helix repeat protein